MFYAGDSTMMIIQYERSGAAEETMQAISDVRALCNEKCFLAGFSVVIKDTKDLVDRELPVYVGLAVVLSLAAMSLTMESHGQGRGAGRGNGGAGPSGAAAAV